jgi:hypothetical protein
MATDNDLDMRPKTPPHQPNAGVTMSEAEMETIVELVFPQSKLTKVAVVPTSDSFNNRIYFLHLLQSNGIKDEVVLKLNGRFFGPSKVQNEVGCLRQLEKHCPHIPSPRVFAWSENGESATLTTPSASGQVSIGGSHKNEGNTHGGWIMTSKVPGTTVAVSELDDGACRDLGRQMAEIVSNWRHNVPAQPLCGNIKLRPQDETEEQGCANRDPIVQGIVMDDLEPSEPLQSVNAYQTCRLTRKMDELASKDTYAPNRHLLPILQGFVQNDLPNMQLAMPLAQNQAGLFVFTHYDLAPRNILVSGQPPKITGIVDFEFSGFFHPMEEFLNDCIDNRADWPATLYTAYQERLEENGIATPIGSMDRAIWNRNYWLETVVNYVAPWWLPGKHEGEGLVKELKKAEAVVLNGLEKALKEPEEQIAVPAYGGLTRD